VTFSGACQSHFGHLVDVASCHAKRLSSISRTSASTSSHWRQKCTPSSAPGDSLRLLFAWWREQMKFLALAAVLALLVAGSAVFVTGHPRAMTACVTDCD
jgi:hypothetical protein